MGATGNQFWKERAKHGRDMIFASPTIMWEAACEYFEYTQGNPFKETKLNVTSNGVGMGSDVEKTEVDVMRPFTLHGLCLFLHVHTKYFSNFRLKTLPAMAEGTVKNDFAEVIARIEETIYLQKFEGAAAGFFNANLISRDIGLAEKVEAVVTEKQVFKFGDQQIEF